MVYGDEAEFTGKPISQVSQQKQQAIARQQQINQENAAVQQQRARAPSSVAAGSPQDVAIRAEEAKQEQQRMVSENIHQVGYSGDIYAKEREAAISSGKFDYSSVRSSFYSPPSTFINPKGETVSRTPSTPPNGPPKDLSTLTTKVTQPTSRPTPKGSGAALDISSQILAKSDALRASMGLPSLEQTERVNVVPSTHGTTETSPKPSGTTIDQSIKLRESLATAQGVPEKEQPTEAVSFLTMPFERTLAKTPIAGLFRPQPTSAQQGTKAVPSAGIVDVLQILPIGIGLAEKGAALLKTLPEAFVREFGPKAEQAGVSAGKGAADIGTNIPKYTDKFRTQKNIQSMISEKMKSPPPEMAKQGREPLAATSEIEVRMGSGAGKLISSGGTASKVTDIFSKPPPEKPTTEIKTSSGVLEQIQKEKTVSKTVQKQKPEFEQRQLSKQEEFLKKQEQKATTKEEQGGKTEQIQKTGMKEILVPITRTRQKPPREENVLITIPTTKTTTPPRQKEKPHPLIPVYVPIQSPKVTTAQGQKQDEEGVGIMDILTVTKIPGKTPNTQPTPPPEKPPTEETTTSKKNPPELFAGLGAGLTGGGGRGEGAGAVKSFIGNVPEASIVGVYKRGEISYTTSSMKSSRSSTAKTISSKRMKLI